MITELCIKKPVEGNIQGICCICGKETGKGHKVPFSDSFTGYSFLIHGDCACPHCWTFFKTRDFRFKSWVANSDGVRFLKRLDIRVVILFPPEPPFFLYITQSGQRQGWLSALKLINYSRDTFIISTDWAGHFMADREIAFAMDILIWRLREKKISKTALRTGGYTMKQTRLAIEGGWHDLIETARGYMKTPLWEVMVYVAE